MADKKISELTAATAASISDEIVLVQSGANKKIAMSKIARKGLNAHCAGAPGDDEVIGGGLAPYDFTITEANCIAKALVAATGSTTVTIKKNGSSIGTVVWSAAGTTGTVDITTATVADGDHITFHAPATADATLADITILIRE